MTAESPVNETAAINVHIGPTEKIPVELNPVGVAMSAAAVAKEGKLTDWKLCKDKGGKSTAYTRDVSLQFSGTTRLYYLWSLAWGGSVTNF